MLLSRESLVVLRMKLFRGSPKIIRERLKKKGISFSTQYISRCLDPDHQNYKQIIIEEAIMIVEENEIQMYDLNHRIELLNDTL
jgi:hypothetical protein